MEVAGLVDPCWFGLDSSVVLIGCFDMFEEVVEEIRPSPGTGSALLLLFGSCLVKKLVGMGRSPSPISSCLDDTLDRLSTINVLCSVVGV